MYHISQPHPGTERRAAGRADCAGEMPFLQDHAIGAVLLRAVMWALGSCVVAGLPSAGGRSSGGSQRAGRGRRAAGRQGGRQHELATLEKRR